MRRRDFIRCVSAFGAASLMKVPSAWADDRAWYELSEPLMGTYVAIAVYERGQSVAYDRITRTFAAIRACIDEISTWQRQSAAALLNSDRRVQLSPQLHRLLSVSDNVYHATRGGFNALAGGLIEVWRAAKAAQSVPSAKDRQEALEVCRTSRWRKNGELAVLTGSSTLDFGGIGKGFVADYGCAVLKQLGVKFARVACSGDIRFLGDTEWQVDIRHPRMPYTLRTVSLSGDAAISTSGDYEDHWSVNGEEYHHLLNLATGLPARENMQLTIVAPSCAVADGLATGLFASPAALVHERAAALGARAMVVSHRGKVSALKFE